jgi:hypothetical protein
LCNASPIKGSSFRLPTPDGLIADGETAQQHDLAKIPQRQPVAQPAKLHERDDIAWQRRPIEDTVTALIELHATVPATEPKIAANCQVWPFGHRC